MYNTFLISHHKLTISHLGTDPTISRLETDPVAMLLLHEAPTGSNHPRPCCSFIHVQSRRPIEAEEEFSFSLVMTFVNIFVGLSFVCIFSIFNYPSSKIDQMKWYHNCMCLVFECRAEFFAR